MITSYVISFRLMALGAGFTQLELSDRIGRPQSFVSKYENGERKLDFVETVEICNACSFGTVNNSV